MDFNYYCHECDSNYDISPDLYLCPKCKKISPMAPLRGVLDVKLKGKINSDFKISDLLPVAKEFLLNIPVGNTPLWPPVNLKNSLGLDNIYIKDDGLNPTGSLKDRASYLIASFCVEHKIDEIVLASTGNAASSMAGIGAASGLKVTIFLPKNAPEAKLVQIIQYGAKCILVDGNYDLAYDLSLEYSRKFGGLNRNTGYNPLTIEGKKTVSLEIFKQLNDVPDYIFVSAGDGVILSGVYKGFEDLLQFGLITKIPTIYAVQSTGSSAIYNAFISGRFSKIEANTIADSISVDNPRNGTHALSKIKKHSGELITVSDEEILAAQKQLSSTTGIFSEPAGATAFAGLLKIKERIGKKSTTVVITTGNGLKDISSARKKITVPKKTISSLEELD